MKKFSTESVRNSVEKRGKELIGKGRGWDALGMGQGSLRGRSIMWFMSQLTKATTSHC